jgi:hypothetical protein
MLTGSRLIPLHNGDVTLSSNTNGEEKSAPTPGTMLVLFKDLITD